MIDPLLLWKGDAHNIADDGFKVSATTYLLRACCWFLILTLISDFHTLRTTGGIDKQIRLSLQIVLRVFEMVFHKSSTGGGQSLRKTF